VISLPFWVKYLNRQRRHNLFSITTRNISTLHAVPVLRTVLRGGRWPSWTVIEKYETCISVGHWRNWEQHGDRLKWWRINASKLFCDSVHLYPPLIDWLWWGETCLRTAVTNGPVVHPSSDMWAWRAMVMMMMPAADNSWLVLQSSLAVLPAESSGETRRNGRRNENLVYPSPWDFKRSLTCRKILRHGTFPLYFPSEGRCTADLIALKMHLLCQVWTRDPWVQWRAH
jgi:hypothetical protein